jgi:hypothetical protein
MPFDAALADRVRSVVAGEDGLTEKRMFGGLAFLVGGSLAVSASSKGGLLVRVDPEQTAALVREPHVRRFEMRGREMDGWLIVDTVACRPTQPAALGRSWREFRAIRLRRRSTWSMSEVSRCCVRWCWTAPTPGAGRVLSAAAGAGVPTG